MQKEADILKQNKQAGRYDVRKCRCKVDPTDYKNLTITMTGKKVRTNYNWTFCCSDMSLCVTLC